MAKITVLILYLLISFHNLLADDLKILKATDSDVTVEFSPGKWQIAEKSYQNKKYISARFSEDQLITESGQPMVPVKIATIGIPPNSGVEYQLIEAVTGDKITGTLVPTPTPLPEYSYEENPEYYQQDSKFPAQIVEISSPGFLRDQRVVQIKFWPVQFDPSTRTVQLYTKIIVKILFSDHVYTSSATPTKLTKDEAFYQSQIVNYEQSRDWRLRRSIKREIRKRQAFSTDWYKIYIEHDGIYKITGKMLSDAGLPTNSIDPATIRIYNNGGTELPRNLFDPRPDSLIENATWVVDDGDAEFDPADYVLFY